MSPRKVRLAANLIKGKEAEMADLELARLPKRAALPLRKLLHSALANARHNFQMEEESKLYVKSIVVDEGIVLKRSRPRAFGRSAIIKKRSSRVTLVLDSRSSAPPRIRKDKPLVREAAPEDIKGADASRPKEERMPAKPRKKTADFVRKFFRRKAV